MDHTLFYALFGVMGTIYFYAGYIISRKVTGVQDYFLAGRSLGLLPLTIALIATQLGGGFILGTSREAYYYGYWGLLYVAGICLGFFALSCGIASRLRILNIETTAQLFQTRYNSVLLRHIASLCSILSLGGIFAGQVVASRTLMIALGVYNPWVFSAFWLVIIIYAMLGGLQAIVKNDVVQLSLIILVFVGLFLVDLFSNFTQGMTVFMHSIAPEVTSDISTRARIIATLLMPACYALIEQDLAQVFFAARNARIAIMGAFSAACFLLLFASIPLYFGIKTKLLGIPLILDANPLMSFFEQTYSSPIVMLITYGVFAAIISSANGVLCAISSNIVQDFNVTRLDKKHTLRIAQSVTFLVGLCGLILGFYATDLIGLLVDSYAMPVVAFLIPLLVAYFTKGMLSTKAAWGSVIAGLGVFGILLYTRTTILIAPECDALLASLIGYCGGWTLDYMFKK